MKANDSQDDEQPWREPDPGPSGEDRQIGCVLHQISPTGLGWTDTHAQKAQAGLGEDRPPHPLGQGRPDRGHRIGQHVPEHDGTAPGPQCLYRDDILLFPDRQRVPIHQPGDGSPSQKSNDQNDIAHGRPYERHQTQDQYNAGKGLEHIGAAHDPELAFPSAVARQEPQRHPHRHTDSGGGEAHQQGNAPAVKKPCEDIPPHVVGPQPMFRGRGRPETGGAVRQVGLQTQQGRQ